jgi:hypothetical protein
MKCNLLTLLTSSLALSIGLGLSAQSQTAPLAIGTVTAVSELANNGQCPGDFFSDTNTPAVCYQAVLNCPSTAAISLIYSQDVPASPIGTVVFFWSWRGPNAELHRGQ